MAPIIQTEDERAIQLLDLARVKYTIVQPTKTQAPIQKSFRKSEYILLDKEHQNGNYSEVDLLVPFERTHLGERWIDCPTPTLLANEEGYMPSPRQHVDFLKLIKFGKAFDGNGNRISPVRLRALYKEITEVREPWRGEWLDAKFGDGTITYHLIEKDGSVRPITESLDNCLMEDKTPGISLNSWLKTADSHGLPTPKTKNGILYSWYPRSGVVARFGADSGRALFDCDWYPSSRDVALGVRVGRKK